MANNLNLPQNIQLATKIVDSDNAIKEKQVEQGFLGKIWGASTSIPNNIAALTIIILVIFGIAFSIFFPTNSENIAFSIKDCWTIITPIITLAFGYLFGEKTKKNGY